MWTNLVTSYYVILLCSSLRPHVLSFNKRHGDLPDTVPAEFLDEVSRHVKGQNGCDVQQGDAYRSQAGPDRSDRVHVGRRRDAGYVVDRLV